MLLQQLVRMVAAASVAVFMFPRTGTYAAIPRHDDTVRVMLIPHTHDDPGWTATIEEYYNGGYEYKHYGVRAIYNSVLSELLKDSRRKFIAVEIAFFSMWWTDPLTTGS